ncbi:nucleotide-binding domain-containing protein [Flagelloscypha sp. PMI_526]|nr:nucleotide-binding domain-containing protein [Flagelloscypha sp. PMI_526]
MPTASPNVKRVTVMGAGVIGLTTAIKLQETNRYAVTIVAEILPTDLPSSRYTSHWAGALHLYLSNDDSNLRNAEKETFAIFRKMIETGTEAAAFLKTIKLNMYFKEPRPSPDPLGFFPDLKPVAEDQFPSPDIVAGLEATSFSIDVPQYLNYLLDRFLSKGGQLVRGHVQHIQQLTESPSIFSGRNREEAPETILLCPGLAARSLGGLEDRNMYPVRGQVLRLKAPWVDHFLSVAGKNDRVEEKLFYAIPRSSGLVVVGGTQSANDWFPVARKETTERILQEALYFFPQLAPPEIRAERDPTVEDLRPLIVDEGCGFRPARMGGVRIERDTIDRSDGKTIPVVYNYGHGGGGYQASWGSANKALALLDEAFVQKSS